MPINHRQMCYNCNRPQNCCLCSYVNPVDTKTKFVILIHPKEFKQIKNNTGRLTHMSLKNSELFVGLDFTNHKKINVLIDDPDNYCVILYPSLDAINLNNDSLDLKGKRLVVFVIDATWASSKPILRLSKNLHSLPKLSFTHNKTSTYGFKRQPFEEALSTMESTHCILEILQEVGVEKFDTKELKSFLNPFEELVKFQSKFKNAEPRFKDHDNLK